MLLCAGIFLGMARSTLAHLLLGMFTSPTNLHEEKPGAELPAQDEQGVGVWLEIEADAELHFPHVGLVANGYRTGQRSPTAAG